MGRNVRTIHVRALLENDFKQMQFLTTIGQLRAKGGGKWSIVQAKTTYKFDKSGRVISVFAEYTFFSWRNVGQIRKRLDTQKPLNLEVFCPNEEPEKSRTARSKRIKKQVA